MSGFGPGPEGPCRNPCPSPAAPVRSDPLRDKNNSSSTRNSTDSSPHGARSSIVMYVPPLLSTFTSAVHFNRYKSSADVYTTFHTSAGTSGLLEGGALIFFRLQASGNVKSNVCMAATFQLMKCSSIPPLQFSILSSASRAAPMRGAMAGDVTPNNVLLIGGYRGHWSGSGLDPESHACCFSLTFAYGSGQSGTRIVSPESFTTGRRFQSFGLNWTWERSSRPIRHLNLLLKSINIQHGSAILPNNLSSLANPLSSFCSTQLSAEQSATETKLTYNTEFLYAFT